MKPELEKLCADYIVNRDTVGKAFRWDSSDLYSVCANMFCACGQAADADRLKECREIIRKHTGLFSKFRPACCPWEKSRKIGWTWPMIISVC